MNENPNTTGGGNIDDVIEIIRRRREAATVPADAPTKLDNQVVKPVSGTPADKEVQGSLFDTAAQNDATDKDGSTAKSNLDTDKTESIIKPDTTNASDDASIKSEIPGHTSASKPAESAFVNNTPAPPKPEDATRVSPIPKKPVQQPVEKPKKPEEKEVIVPKATPDSSGTVSLNDFDSISEHDVKKPKKRTKEKFYIPGYVKVIIYLIIVLATSIFLSVSAILIGNDVFSFKKPEREYKLTVPENPSWDKIAVYFNDSIDNSFAGIDVKDDSQFLFGDYATLDTVANALYDNGVIEYLDVFKFYAGMRMDESYYTGRFIPGDYKISSTGNSVLNYDNLIKKFAENKYKKEIVKVTIPEGYSVYQILDLLEKNHVIDKTSRLKLEEKLNCHYYDYKFLPKKPEDLGYVSDTDRYQHLAISYAMLDTLAEKDIISEDEKLEYIERTTVILDAYAPVKSKINENVIYNLEGFLFPDTYEFYVGEDLDSIVNKFLSNFQVKYEDVFYASNTTKTPDFEEIKDVVILASMIQAEGNNSADFYLISNVFHNRLRNPGRIGRSTPILESDATSVYVLQGSKRRSEISADDIKTLDSPYNTYTNPGLPPGPICNPGHDAIHAALYPADYITKVNENGDVKRIPVEYYYFYTAKSNGKTYFSETLSQHNAFVSADMRGDVEELERLQNVVNS